MTGLEIDIEDARRRLGEANGALEAAHERRDVVRKHLIRLLTEQIGVAEGDKVEIADRWHDSWWSKTDPKTHIGFVKRTFLDVRSGEYRLFVEIAIAKRDGSAGMRIAHGPFIRKVDL